MQNRDTNHYISVDRNINNCFLWKSIQIHLDTIDRIQNYRLVCFHGKYIQQLFDAIKSNSPCIVNFDSAIYMEDNRNFC